MSSPATPTPIIVNSSPAPTQLVVAVRQILLAAGGFAAALGFANAGTVLGQVAEYAGPIAVAVSFVLGQIHTLNDHNRKVTMAAAAPSEVAIVK